MTTPRNIAADQLSALLALLQQKRFSEVLNATKGMSEYPEASVLSSLALIGEGKLYAANAALKSWITNINERRLFANLAKTAGLNCDDLYERCAPHDLGHLMWTLIESGSLSFTDDTNSQSLLPYKMQLLHPSRGLNDSEQQRLMQELVSSKPSAEKMVQLANTVIPATTFKYGPRLTEYLLSTLDTLQTLENTQNKVELLMQALSVIIRLGPAGNALADKLLQKTLSIDPEKKQIILSMYLQVARLGKKEFDDKYVYRALEMINGLPEFTDDSELNLQMKWQRLIDYYDYYIKMSWYKENEAFELAARLFRESPMTVSFPYLLHLTSDNKLSNQNTWSILESLYGSFVQMDWASVQPLLPEAIANCQWSEKEKLLELLMLLAVKLDNNHLKQYLDDYKLEQLELQRQERLIQQMRYENFHRNPSLGGFLSEPNVDRHQEPVLLGVSAPQVVPKASEFTARFVAYEQRMEEEVRETILQMSPRSTSTLGIKKCYWQQGTEITVRLSGRHITVDNPEERFTWEGEMSIIDFDVSVSGDVNDITTVLKFDVLIGGFTVGKIRVDLAISDTQETIPRQRVAAKPFRTAFASYASKDRGRVLDRVAEINRNGIDVFLDCLSIRPGEKWKPVLETEIQKCSTFLLFWSIHAKQSEMVSWEWRTALRLKGLDAIEPHPLDPVECASPPDELKDLHFGDVYMLVRKATEKS